MKPDEIQRKFSSKELKVKPKGANIASLQIADLLATEIKREILAVKVGSGSQSRFSLGISGAIRTKHRASYSGDAWGMGKIWIGPRQVVPSSQKATTGQ